MCPAQLNACAFVVVAFDQSKYAQLKTAKESFPLEYRIAQISTCRRTSFRVCVFGSRVPGAN